MSNSNSKYILPTCALVGSFFGVACIQYSLGLFFEAYGSSEQIVPDIIRLAWKIHDYRWVILVLGTLGLLVAVFRSKSETKTNIISGLYMLIWFALCFFVQFCLIYGLQRR